MSREKENRILKLAERCALQQLPREVWEPICDKLLAEGISWEELRNILLNHLQADLPMHFLNAIGNVCAYVAEGLGDSSCAADIHFAIGDWLDERIDPQSLTIAISQYSSARQKRDAYDLEFCAHCNLREAGVRSKLAEFGLDSVKNLKAALFLENEAADVIDSTNRLYAELLNTESCTRMILADFGIDPIPNLHRAVDVSKEAATYLTPFTPNFGVAKMNEGVSLCRLSEAGIAPDENAEAGAAALREAAECIDTLSPYIGPVLQNNANAHLILADRGIDPLENLKEAIKLLEESDRLAILPEMLAGRQRLNQAVAYTKLSELGEDPELHFVRAIEISKAARELLPPETPHYLTAMLNEANARRGSAMLGINPQDNLATALELCMDAQSIVHTQNMSQEKVQSMEALIRFALAESGQATIENLKRSIDLSKTARENLPPNSTDFARIQLNEASAHIRLADSGIQPVEHLHMAIELYQQVHPFGRRGRDIGILRRNEATARRKLALHNIEVQDNLNKAKALYILAEEQFEPHSPDLAMTRMGLANIYQALAEQEKRTENLQEAQRLYHKLTDEFSLPKIYRGLCLANEARAQLELAKKGVERDNKLQQSIILWEQAAECFEEETSSWGLVKRSYAEALCLADRHDEAYGHLEQGLSALEKIRSEIQSECDRIDFFEEVATQFGMMVKLCLQLADLSLTQVQKQTWFRRAWHWGHRSKARTFLELLAGSTSQYGLQDKILWGEFEDISRQLFSIERSILQQVGDRFDLSGPLGHFTDNPENQLDSNVEQLRKEYRAKRQQVLTHLENTRSSDQVRVPNAERTLKALVELCRQSSQTNDSDSEATNFSKTMLVEFYCLNTQNIIVFLIPLWEPKEIIVEQLNLAHDLLERSVISILLANEEYKEDSSTKMLVDKVAPYTVDELPNRLMPLIETWAVHLEEWRPTELLLSPHYVLNFLPLHAISFDGGPLIESYPISYLPSPAVAEQIVLRSRPLGTNAVLLGNPTNDLPFAELEVSKIHDILQQNEIKSSLHIQNEATCEVMKNAVTDASIVHLACHSRLEQDFLESGIELADHRLTVLEIAESVRFNKSCMVFLGSCENARSITGRTDEFMALVRAFFSAGTPTVAATLWTTSDEVSFIFSTNFYKFWISERQPLAVAFQQAMLCVRKLEPKLISWAPFILMGAWNVPVD